MDENKELKQPEPTGEKTSRLKSLNELRRKLANNAISGVKSLGETFAITNERVPLEEINTQTVSERILKLGNPLQERMENDRYANPFDITSVIAELGYIGMLNNMDYLKKFPGVYQAVRQSLWGLEQQGVLESRDLERNSHGESKYYKVINLDLLKQAAVIKQEK